MESAGLLSSSTAVDEEDADDVNEVAEDEVAVGFFCWMEDRPVRE